MRVLHLKSKDHKTSVWSGGTTTELFIWPKGADYGKREFSFRVSSAVVALSESDFTPLNGVMRWITPISGGFTLTHPGKPAVMMASLDAPYFFSGEEDTHCVGSATDFNLMLKGVAGSMTVCRGEGAVLPGFNCYYALEDGAFQLGEEHRMAAGELLVVFSAHAATIRLGDHPVIACHVEVERWEDF